MLRGLHSRIFRGEKDTAAYNNHAYIARFENQFFVLWSCGRQGGGQDGQQLRYATSDDGETWSPAAEVMPRPEHGHFTARGLWIREGKLLALAARCTGEGPSTQIEALEAYAWNPDNKAWQPRGPVVEQCTINYPPMHLPSGEWLVPYRFKTNKRVDGVLIGGVQSLDSWRRIPFPGAPLMHFTEANAILRGDGSIAVHFRDNAKSGFLYRSVSEDGGQSFSPPRKTDFPDCKAKHFCLKLSNGQFILTNNPYSRKELHVAGSSDGRVFTHAAILRNEPTAVRNPGKDKNHSPYTYPHAMEFDGDVYFVYAVYRDDIWITRVSLEELGQTLGRAS